MNKYRKRPIVIEAIQWDGSKEVIRELLKNNCPMAYGKLLYIITLEGRMRADIGDWIIRGVAGEFYPCKPDIFEITYERIEKDTC